MKRLLIATLALTTILTACSDEDRIEMFDKQAYVDDKAAEEVAETEIDNSDRHHFEVGESLAERRESNPFAGASDAANKLSKELSEAIDNASIQSYEMNDVIIKVMDVERSEFAHGTLIDVEYAVENTVKERRMVPLERTPAPPHRLPTHHIPTPYMTA